ncbi:IclR family transcriptional regulator [Halegenticoccus soli]|uniref:IclR family transcriptional regulator n=1 Tax=Halegenticoccus soli TaxID=1985678 RepID=UPI001E5C37F1|nr:IclR family transcriptional regulator [Halegenticoccus soli]
MVEHAMSQAKEAKHPIKSSRTTFRIVEALKELDGAGITEVANHLNLSKSSVHNYLDTLRHEGYVMKHGQQYHVGLKFLELGAYARRRRKLFEISKPEVERLADETGEVVNLLVEEQGKGIYLCREKGTKAVKLDTSTGMFVHLHQTAFGKAIMAYMDREQVESIIDRHGLPARTDNTITDRKELFEELNRIHEQGYALDMEEYLDGLQGVAVPILNNGTTVEGAISIAGPSCRMRGERLEETLPRKIQNAVNVIELNITHS